MSDVKQIFENNKFPSFITNHSIFRSIKEVKKVFPEIGLPNTEKEIEVDNKKEALAAAKTLLSELKTEIDVRLQKVNKYGSKKSEDMGNKRKRKLENINLLLGAVKTQLTKSNAKCIVSNNGRMTLNLAEDVVDIDGKVAFKAGEGVFRVYNKLNDTLRDGHFLAMDKLEELPQFKDFSSKNVPALKYKIRFSSDGSEGAWDIATMSQRGIQSCQSWNGGHSSHVVGSIVDPFTGILYLTSGGKFNEYGSKMIRRCVVRFVVTEKTGIPFLALEKMYPSMERGALDSFIGFLKERTDNKFDIKYLPEIRGNNFYVPMSKVVNKLNVQDQPYRDSQTVYKTDPNCKYTKLKNDLGLKLEAIYSAFPSKVVAAARSIKIGSVPKESKAAFKSLRGNDYMWDSSYALYQDLRNYIVKFFEKFDESKYNDSGLFLRDAITALIAENLETKLYTSIKSFASNKIPKACGTLDDDVVKMIAKTANEKLTTYFEAELKKIKVVEGKMIEKLTNPAEIAIPIYTKLL